MPDYEDYPVEGYIYNEPDGRPRPGGRYRDPEGDNRVLWSLVSLFVVVCLGIGAFAWMERSNTLTEWAFGDDRHPCQLSRPVLLLTLDVEEVRKHRPEVLDAPGFALDIDTKTLDGDDVASVTQFFDTRDLAWDSDGVSFGARFSGGSSVGICDVELRPLMSSEQVPNDATVPTPCNRQDGGDRPGNLDAVPALASDGPCG